MLKIGWDNDTGRGLLQKTAANALALDESMETLVLLSLFTHVEATEAEIAAAGLDRQEGWWADATAIRDPGTPRLGSKLWLLSRGKLSLDKMRLAEQYARESLSWLIDQGIAATVTVTATRPRPDVLGLDVTITRPTKLLPPFKQLWEFNINAV